jgi:uncharacterized protein YegL
MSTKVKIYNLIVLDKSSSMSCVRDVTIEGLNEQLQSIRKSQEDFPEQEQILCFATFSNNVDCDLRWNKPISEVDDFTTEDYSPQGMTALHDAVGVGITKLREEIKDALANRSATVMVSIFTDGQENCSKEFNRQQSKALVGEVKEGGMWTVSFIGCGNDVFDVAEGYGIGRGDTLSYTAGAAGTQRAFMSMSKSRSVRNAAYSQTFSKGLEADDLATELESLNNDGNFFDNLDIEPEPTTDNKTEEIL